MGFVRNKAVDKTLIFVFGLTVTFGLWFVDDRITGPEMTFTLLYLVPISLTAWFGGLKAGVTLALFCSTAWLIVDANKNQYFMHSFLSYLNLSSKIVIYIGVAVILDKLNRSLKHEKELSLTDFSTGASNRRAFTSVLETEVERAARYGHPTTLIFMDLDNFKDVNDNFGHPAGDDLLCLTVKTIKENIRSTDVVARMGGDEFAVLLPETDFESAKSAVNKIHSHLMGLSDKLRRGTTFSIGMVTYSKAPSTADEVVKAADRLMYEVKNSGKNAVKYRHVE